MNDIRWLTDGEAGALIGKSSKTISRWRKSSGLPFLPGRPVLIELTDFTNFIEQRKKRVFRYAFARQGPVPATHEEMLQKEKRSRARLRNMTRTRRALAQHGRV